MPRERGRANHADRTAEQECGHLPATLVYRIHWYHKIASVIYPQALSTCGMDRKDEKMTEQVLVRLKPSLARVVDTWRRQQLDFPSRADAIRRLTAMALKTAGMQLPDQSDEEPKAKKKRPRMAQN